NVAKFGPQTLHNTKNVIPLDSAIHTGISAYYSRIRPNSGGLTVREWLSTQSFDAQREFGIEILKSFGALP
ncbi:MAG: hypothetical protein L6Q76_07420, partial [Polyangiaceae bacterium]|nr:hypothetical protein [Polyangiaceae bacterium]